ncbi:MULTISPECIES: DUF445 domain-containing protein [Aliivibrio]|uniref:DUF445 domain-containing protein n=1 Tax=Aliivibrio logei TaxID=688 RepID=A0A1B9NW54_ALILO|nr:MULTISPECIES: DUF445 domain-containing protein [Aliivibrio]MBB1315616.1 DUF445 domain-containing protein [Aliivibrio sp. SR45-2]OCH19449.1 DUF445 domain-containing protein [Aliivibrio logei]
MLNKSMITNLISLALLAVGYYTQQNTVYYIGLFAFSGALTNWLAIHMLFEKVPGLYGSGVIPARFEEFKASIKRLMMDQFFTKSNVDRFLSKGMGSSININLEPVIDTIDLSPTFDSLVDVIMNSQFGGMIAMMGGSEAIQPLREPFMKKMKLSITEISQQEQFKTALKGQLETPDMMDDIQKTIEEMIDQRLNELTPKLVKEMVQDMIKKHLGWLVVWGGIFGGVIGLLSTLI